MKTKTLFTALALLIGASHTHAGIHHWNGGGGNELWSNPANWIEGPPTAGEAAPVELEFPIAGVKTLTNDIPGLTVDTLRFFGSGFVLRGSGGGALTLRGGQAKTIYCRGVNTIAASLPLILQGTSVIEVDGGTNVMILSSVVSGAGGLTKIGLGTLEFASVNNNTYSGTTTVLRGPLHLANAAIMQSKIAVPGPLVIGDGTPTNSPNVRLLAHHQIANTSPVTINENGTLRLNGFNDTIGALTMTGGTIYTDDGADVGTLTLNGDVTYHHTPTIVGGMAGHLSLGSVTRTFNIVSGTLNLDQIAGGPGAGLIKTGNGTLGLAGPSTFDGPTIVNDGGIKVSHAFALGDDLGATTETVVNSSGYLSLADGITISNETLYLNDGGELSGVGTCDWRGPVVLDGSAMIFCSSGTLLTVEGVISGAGSLDKSGFGTLRFAGPTANTFSGGMFVNHGTLQLAKFSNVAAIPGPLTVGQSSGAADSDKVVLMAHNQIADDAEILITESGLLDVNSQVESLGPITLDGGHLDSGGLFLNLVGDVVTRSNQNTSAFIDGGFWLGGSGVFDTQAGGVIAALQIRGQILGDANHPLVKRGLGTLRVSNPNNLYNGLTLVQEGHLWLANGAPGSTVSGTVISNRATLSLSHNIIVGNESLVLPSNGAGNTRAALVSFFGTNWWGGPITLASNAAIYVQYPTDWLTVHSAITGNYNLTKLGPGTLEFSGDVANTYANTEVVDGVLALDKVAGATAIPGALKIGYIGTNTAEVRLLEAHQLHDLSAVSVTTNGFFNLDHHLETIGSLAGAGRVNLGFASLRAGGDNTDTTFSGAISGIIAASFTKEGSGQMFLTGTNTYPGKTFVNAGRLVIDGQQSSGVTVNPGAALNGHGTVGALIVTNGLLSPGLGGLFGPGITRLSSGQVALDGKATYHVDLCGTEAGSNYSQLNVIGTVNLGTAGLAVKLRFASGISNQFMIVKNDGIDPVVGAFKGLPQGATATFDGAQFKISYVGGTGNDVVLTQVSATPAPKIERITKLPNGHIQFFSSGIPGVSYEVEVNVDPTTPNWLPLGLIVASFPDGILEFIDTDAGYYSQSYYRLVIP